MALLAVGTAWWSVGSFARIALRRERPLVGLVALAVTLFSSSWFYDGYLLLRDGAYTPRWLGNLMLSPMAYVAAGFVANLEVHEGKVALAFTRDDWPKPASQKPSWGLALATLPLVLLAAWVLVGVVGWRSPL